MKTDLEGLRERDIDTAAPRQVQVLVPGMDVTQTVTYRLVDDEEIPLLKPLFDKLGWTLPDIGLSKVLVAEAGEGANKVVLGFAVAELLLHIGNMFVMPQVLGTGVADELGDRLVHYAEHDCQGITRVIAVAKPGSIPARMMEKHDFRPVHGKQLYVKLIQRS